MRHRGQKSEYRMQSAGWPCAAGLALLMLVFGVAAGVDVKVAADARQANVSIIRRVDVSYYLLTGKTPLEFDVQGPGWVRVYARLWWPQAATGKQKYRMLLTQDEAERPVEFATGLSPSSYGPKGRKLGEWRSFFIEVPAGNVHYRLALDQAVSDTVAVRFVSQAPKPWESVVLPSLRRLHLAEGKDTTSMYELAKGKPFRLELAGPCRVRVRSRLNFEPSMAGTQSFVVSAKEGKTEIARRSMRAGRSPAAAYLNEPAFVPSVERTLRFNLPEGRHELSLQLSGTLARTGAIAVDVLPGEKYE